MTKLNDVCGRIDYISNPKRQEYLYATFSTVKPEFWDLLSAQSQMDFWKSNQKGKCTEARELVIALPESFQEMDADEILKKFVEKFRGEYGMQCTAALHHNKTKNNLHIHLIFSDRELLEKTEEKIATRNMFYDENGRHVRTKKEILDEEGNIRAGCRIIKKGNPYEIRFFGPRKEEFKSRKFLPEVKDMYTDLINELVPDKNEKQKVFDPKGPYLPTKKIYAITKTIENLEAQLKGASQNMFNRKDRRALEEKIESEKEKLNKAKTHLKMLPKMKGYASVKEAEEAYRKAAGIYHTLQRKAEGKPMQKTKKPEKRESVLLQMAESKKLLDEQERKPKSDKKVRAQER